MTELQALRDAYRHDKAALLATLPKSLARSRAIHTPLRKLSQLTSTLLCTLWQRAALPDSAYSQRMVERLRPLVVVLEKRGYLTRQDFKQIGTANQVFQA